MRQAQLCACQANQNMLNQSFQSPLNIEPIQITIIGFGNVGRQILAQLLEEQFRPYNINIVDPNPEIKGSIYDLLPAGNLRKIHRIYLNHETHFNDADFIFYAAGSKIQKGDNKTAILQRDVEDVQRHFENYSPYKIPLIIVISKPVEVLCQAIKNISNLPWASIIGLGTLVDSLRLEYFIAQKLQKQQNEIKAWVLGQHGEYIVPAFSHTLVNGLTVTSFLSKEELEECAQETKNAVHHIEETQGESYFTAAKAAVFLLHAYSSLTQEILPLTVYHPARNIFVSLPVKIGKKQIHKVADFELSQLEQNQLDNAIEAISSKNDCIFQKVEV
jgi:malate/lactate dehydrogenase